MTTNVSQNWAKAELVLPQREIVEQQLADMYNGNAPKHFQVIGDVLKQLQTSMDVPVCTLLDVGCASGYYYAIIEHYVPGWIKYQGLDYNLTMLDAAQDAYPGINVAYGNILGGLHVPEHSYDIVLSGAVLPHLQDWETAVAELVRVTKRYLILHRTWVFTDDTPTTGHVEPTYCEIPVWFGTINEQELLDICGLELISQYASGESSRGLGHDIKTYVFRRK